MERQDAACEFAGWLSTIRAPPHEVRGHALERVPKRGHYQHRELAVEEEEPNDGKTAFSTTVIQTTLERRLGTNQREATRDALAPPALHEIGKRE